jgi:hypothetical protein
MKYDPEVTEHRGVYGRAQRIEIAPDARNASESVCCYLITAPIYHPLWTQYRLDVIKLRDIQGMPPPILKFEGATHELMVLALNPEHGHWTPEKLDGGRVATPYLTPVNIAEQYTATDDEMRHTADLCAQAVVHGVLNPEVADSPELVRMSWLSATVKSLAHIRGEEHAS